MYICQYCGFFQKPNKKQFRVTVEERRREDDSSEIVRELLVCEDCKNELEALPLIERR